MKTVLMAVLLAVAAVAAGCAPISYHLNPHCHEPLRCDGGR